MQDDRQRKRKLFEEALTAGEGVVIGRYRLLQQIGQGGFGVVHMAEQTGSCTPKRLLLEISQRSPKPFHGPEMEIPQPYRAQDQLEQPDPKNEVIKLMSVPLAVLG